MPDVRLGVDVGGTFTDFVAFNPDSGSFSVGKTLTTPHDLARGIIQGTREAAERSGFAVKDISQVTYGTTLVANLLLERKGVRVGFDRHRGVPGRPRDRHRAAVRHVRPNRETRRTSRTTQP